MQMQNNLFRTFQEGNFSVLMFLWVEIFLSSLQGHSSISILEQDREEGQDERLSFPRRIKNMMQAPADILMNFQLDFV